MEFLERIWATLDGGQPDQIPYAPYDNLVPRGSFERKLRSMGMGLCARRSGIWSETPNVHVERRNEGTISRTIYHTPKGEISTAHTTRHDRLSDSGSVQIEWLIKDEKDFEPAISMIDDTIFHRDDSFEANIVRDFGDDGIVRGGALNPPYDSTENFFGLSNWVYARNDYPESFARLLQALEHRQSRLFPLAVESKLKYVGFGSVSGSYSPADYEKYTLPFYQKYVPLFQERDKICAIHAHASNLVVYQEMIKATGCKVVEAFTPPPVGDLSITNARKFFGPETVIWVNFPETIFYEGKEAVAQYTRNLIESDPTPSRLVIGFTEMGLFGITDAYTEKAFKDGFLAIGEVLNEFGRVS